MGSKIDLKLRVAKLILFKCIKWKTYWLAGKCFDSLETIIYGWFQSVLDSPGWLRPCGEGRGWRRISREEVLALTEGFLTLTVTGRLSMRNIWGGGLVKTRYKEEDHEKILNSHKSIIEVICKLKIFTLEIFQPSETMDAALSGLSSKWRNYVVRLHWTFLFKFILAQ